MTPIRGLISRDLNICLILFSSISVGLRLYVRGSITKALGLDDAFSVAALVVLTAQSSLEIVEVSNGAGMHMVDIAPDRLQKFFSILPTMELLYFIAMGFVRLSITCLLPRLSKERNIIYLTWGIGSAIVTMTIICFFVMLFECKHIPDLWNPQRPGAKCISSKSQSDLFWAHASIGLVIDTLLFVIPLWIIYSKMMFSATKKRVLLLFSVGLLVIITGAVRLGIIVRTNFYIDTTYYMIKTTVLTDLEGHVGLWVGCWPTLQPLLRIARNRLGLSSTPHTASGAPISNMHIGKPKSQGYVQHGLKRADSLSDDASGKGIVGQMRREELDLEMNYFGSVTANPVQKGDGGPKGNMKGIVMTTDVVINHH